MNTKLVMLASAMYMSGLGVLMSFLPQELLTFLDVEVGQWPTLFLQVIGAMYLGFAMLNWMHKGALIGGIYNRPVVIANLMHFGVVALALLKLGASSDSGVALIGLTVLYLVFAVCFGVMLMRSPV